MSDLGVTCPASNENMRLDFLSIANNNQQTSRFSPLEQTGTAHADTAHARKEAVSSDGLNPLKRVVGPRTTIVGFARKPPRCIATR